MDLALGAATVGVSPLAGTSPRTFAELLWRIAIVLANLTVDAQSGRWVRSPSYDRLDPSEKSAVSYFLGITQAQVMCQRLLQVDCLTHVDALLEAVGQPRAKVRSDLVGYSTSNRMSVAVEAKGRTNGYTAQLLRKTKGQARKLPMVTLPHVPAGTTHSPIALVPWFDTDGSWHSRLEDRPSESVSKVPWQAVLAQFYRPVADELVDALELGIARYDDRGVFVPLRPGLTLGMARGMFDTVRSMQSAWPDRDLESIGFDLNGALVDAWERPMIEDQRFGIASWTKDCVLAMSASGSLFG